MNLKQRQEKYTQKKLPIKEIKAVKHHSEWIMDKKGFFLIDPRPEEGLIYAHHYKPNKEYNCTITGKNAEDIYYTILREKLIENMMHAAYLGSELQKAEILLKYNIDWYIQDQEFQIPEEMLNKKFLEQNKNNKDQKTITGNKDPEACEVKFSDKK